MTTCTCGKPTPETTYVCSDCTSDLRATLLNMPVLLEDLTLTMSKQRRFGDPVGGGKAADTGLPFNMAAANVLHELRYELLATVRLCLTSNVPSGHDLVRQPAAQPAAMAAWLLDRVDGIVGQPWAPGALRVVGIAARAEYVIDAPAERTFAGPCDQCGNDLYARAGKLRVTCHDCGLAYDLVARRKWLLTMVNDRLATATEIARALTSLRVPVTAERIRQWKHRDRIEPKSHDRLGRPLFRVGDVVHLLDEYADKAS